jgi:hypothetical protein
MALALHNFKPGDRVIIMAKDDFFAFVDGWRGQVTGFNSGLVVVVCKSSEDVDGIPTLIDKTFFVPADQLGFDLLGGP